VIASRYGTFIVCYSEELLILEMKLTGLLTVAAWDILEERSKNFPPYNQQVHLEVINQYFKNC